MPYEHSSKQPTQQPSKKRKRTYRRISKQDKQLFKYANSIIESIQHLNGRTVIHDLYVSVSPISSLERIGYLQKKKQKNLISY